LSRAALLPARAAADMTRLSFQEPDESLGQHASRQNGGGDLRTVRALDPPLWPARMGHRIHPGGGERVPVEPSVVWQRPFCRLVHFELDRAPLPRRPQPRMLIVAPMSGHHATLLRGTSRPSCPITTSTSPIGSTPSLVPLTEGRFDLEDYVDYLRSMLHFLGGGVHMVAVCQPSVPVLAAVAVMEAAGDPNVPHSMVLMGGPIDTRENPTGVNKLAEMRGTDWFRRNVITKVPFPHPGFMRDVYPGFISAARLRQHEPRPPHRGASQAVPPTWSRARAIRRRSTANSTTSISPSWI